MSSGANGPPASRHASPRRPSAPGPRGLSALRILPIAVAVLACPAVAGLAQTEGRRPVRHSDVVFMYAPGDPGLYDAYGCGIVLWGSGPQAAEAARERGVRFQGSIWFLTAWGDKLAEDPELLRAVCVDIEGKPIEVPWLTDHRQALPNYWGCTTSPYYREYCKQRALEAVQGAVTGLHIDDHAGTAACASWAGGCFCESCIVGFRDFLRRNYTPEQLSAMGVRDVATFDYTEYVRGYATTRQEYLNVRWSIPLFVPYVSFEIEGEASLVGEIREACEAAVGRSLFLSANTCLPNPVQLGDYQHLDTLCGETDLHAGAGRPVDSAHFPYKLAEGLGRPLAATASGGDWAWVSANGKPGLVKCWTAESYAFGQRLMAPHHQWCYTPEKGTHWWDGRTEDFAPLYRWVADHPALLDGFETVSDTVLVFNAPACFRGADASPEVAGWLASHNVQYRCAVAGGDWVGERLDRASLLAADRVIVSSREGLDDDQRATLDAVRQAGKLIEWSGPESLGGLLPPSVEVTGDGGSVWATVRRNAATGEVAVHLLGRAYDLASDSVPPLAHVRVSIARRLLGDARLASAVAYAVPAGEPRSLDLATDDDRVSFELPELGMWSVVVLTP